VVTGDLTTAFNLYKGEKNENLPFLERDSFFEKIYNAKFKKVPSDFRPLSKAEIERINKDPSSSPLMPHQEKGIRASCALPYQLYADGKLDGDRKAFELTMAAKDEIFGKRSAGSPFNVYIKGKYASKNGTFESTGRRSYAVIAGDSLTDSWPLKSFEEHSYH